MSDTHDLLRISNKQGALRYRTRQVKAGEKLMKPVHAEERRIDGANVNWIPHPKSGATVAEKLECIRARGFML